MKAKSIKFVAMTVHEANMRLLFDLFSIYDDSEASGIANLIMEHLTGWSRIDRVMNKNVKLSLLQEEQLERYTAELLQHKPVQYVLQEAWFAGMKFFVDKNVLVPRPETEELVEWAKKNTVVPKKILDIGTGSGCIAVALKKHFVQAEVYAIDVSGNALEVAAKNALMNNVEINFQCIDILDESQWQRLPSFDVIVSNPPYIPVSEKHSMRNNVVDFEPHTALFVENSDRFLFYRKTVKLAEQKKFATDIYFEIHESYGEELKELFAAYQPVIRKDLQGKDRMMLLRSEGSAEL